MHWFRTLIECINSKQKAFVKYNTTARKHFKCPPNKAKFIEQIVELVSGWRKMLQENEKTAHKYSMHVEYQDSVASIGEEQRFFICEATVQRIHPHR